MPPLPGCQEAFPDALPEFDGVGGVYSVGGSTDTIGAADVSFANAGSRFSFRESNGAGSGGVLLATRSSRI